MKVDEIRPDEVMVGQAAAMNQDVDWLAARRSRFVEVHCPACGKRDFEPLYEKYGMVQVRCRNCATQYANPRPDAETLRAFYATSANYAYWAKHVFPASGDARREKIFRPRAEIVRRLVESHGLVSGTLVEVGAAYGLFCDEIRRLDLFDRVIAIEPTPNLADICRGMGIETIESSFEAVTMETAADFIASFEVIEHLFDPSGFLAWCHRTLGAGGHLLLTCPNIEGFETIVLGRGSGAVDHEHVNLFTPRSLSLLLERQGFEVVEATTPGELDVELVQRAIAEGTIDAADLGPFLVRCIENGRAGPFQEFLRRAGLSSNMMVLARKPPKGASA